MPSISVAMATFNGERFLNEQLASLKAQTLAPAELVVCDDCSSDRTQAIIEEFSRSSPFPVRWIKNETRLGYRHNFMKAAGHAAGDIIAFCDQDDIWAPDKLLKSSKPFEDPNMLMSYHCVDLIDADGIQIGRYRDRAPPVNPLTDRDFHPWLFGLGFTLMFRAKLNGLAKLWPSSRDFFYDDGRPLAHDQWFFLLAAVMGSITYIDEPLAKYRQHTSNVYGFKRAEDTRRVTYRERLKERYRRYLTYEAHCKHNSKILLEAASILDANDAAKAQKGSKRYSSLETFAGLSAQLIGHPQFSRRMRALRQLWTLGYYDHEVAVPFERRRISKDILACMAPTVM